MTCTCTAEVRGLFPFKDGEVIVAPVTIIASGYALRVHTGDCEMPDELIERPSSGARLVIQ